VHFAGVLSMVQFTLPKNSKITEGKIWERPVQRTLQTLEQTLTRKPLNIVHANKALKEAVSRVVINPESAELLLHWHHAPDQPTHAGPFASQHMTAI
jgi:hypothetical protein